MQGSKYSEKEIEKARQLLAAGKSVMEVSDITGIPDKTLYKWRNNWERDQNFRELKKKKKEEFIDRTERIINKASTLLERTIDEALRNENKIEASKLSTIIGTLYDKKALAEGNSTANVTVRTYEDTLRRELETVRGNEY